MKRQGLAVVAATLVWGTLVTSGHADPQSDAYLYKESIIFGAYGDFAWSEQTGDNNLDRDVFAGTAGVRFNVPLRENWRLNFTGEYAQDVFDQTDAVIVQNYSWASTAIIFNNGEGSSIGAEGGFRYHANDDGGQTVGKFGGLGRVRIGNYLAFNAYGGGLFPAADEANLRTSFYAGGELTGYVADDLSFSGFMDWSKDRIDAPGEWQIHSLRTGGKAKYLCPTFEGLRAFGSVAYVESWQQNNGTKVSSFDGFEIRLGLSYDLFSSGQQPNKLSIYDDFFVNTTVFSLPRESNSP